MKTYTKMKTTKEFLNDWVEPEDAIYYLGCNLGVFEYYEEFNAEYYRKIKAVFAVETTIGTMLYEMLEQMVKGGLLEKRDDWEYRWNESYKGYWEGGKD